MIRLYDLVPPIVHKVSDRLRRRAAGGDAVGSKTFPDFAAAAAMCSGGWNDDSLTETIVADAKLARDRAVVTPLELRAIQAVAWALADGAGVSGSLRVVEFGGSAGFNYSPMQAFFPSVDIRWAIVETPAMVRSAAQELAGVNLSFMTSLKEAAGTIAVPDLVFSCGVLQYLPDPLSTLRDLIALEAPRLVLFRTALNGGDAPVYAVQEAVLSQHLVSRKVIGDIDRQVRYPVTFAPRAAFRDVLRGAYDIVAEVDEGVLNPLPSPMHGFAFFCRRRVDK